MKEHGHGQIPESGQSQHGITTSPAMEPDIELTPKAEAKVANKLPRSEQMSLFKKDLQAHDPGNQPA